MKRGRVRHLTLDELGLVIGGGNVQTRRGDDPSGIHWVFVRMAESHELVVADKFRKREARCPAQRFDRLIARMLQRLGRRRQFGAARNSIEPADARIYRMDLATSEQTQELIAGLLERQRALHRVAMIARHRDRIRVAEEVRMRSRW